MDTKKPTLAKQGGQRPGSGRPRKTDSIIKIELPVELLRELGLFTLITNHLNSRGVENG